MLIVKGESGKSILANIILEHTDSKCFIYNDYPLIYNSVCLDSTKYPLSDLKQCIKDCHPDDMYSDDYYDYLIVYTNQKEEDLAEFIDWLHSQKHLFRYKNALVMCNL